MKNSDTNILILSILAVGLFLLLFILTYKYGEAVGKQSEKNGTAYEDVDSARDSYELEKAKLELDNLRRESEDAEKRLKAIEKEGAEKIKRVKAEADAKLNEELAKISSGTTN